MWDSAAQQMWMKKARVEKWCELAGVAEIDSENQPLVLPLDHGEEANVPVWWSSERLESPQDGQDNWQWASDMFDGIDYDAALLNHSGDWHLDEIGDPVLIDGSNGLGE